ncbi:copper resistance protein NlpE N-terminal domain-containing protein [Kushneria konosiri]|nr:copper resistance protein NlpE N-terminal domain-containing protein [Kushneria konosiri]
MTFKGIATTAVLASVIGLAGCSGNDVQNQSPYAQADGRYQGTLPCADCAGIKTNLEIRNQNNTGASFTLDSTRLGQSEKPLQTKGQVLIKQNVGPNSYPLVYELKNGQGNTIYNLLPVGNGDMRLLDRNYTRIDSSDNLTLKRIN